jgi:hypothetical protein
MSDNRFGYCDIVISFCFGFYIASYLNSPRVRYNEEAVRQILDENSKQRTEYHTLNRLFYQVNGDAKTLREQNGTLQAQCSNQTSIIREMEEQLHIKKILEKRICSDTMSIILSYIG